MNCKCDAFSQVKAKKWKTSTIPSLVSVWEMCDLPNFITLAENIGVTPISSVLYLTNQAEINEA